MPRNIYVMRRAKAAADKAAAFSAAEKTSIPESVVVKKTRKPRVKKVKPETPVE